MGTRLSRVVGGVRRRAVRRLAPGHELVPGHLTYNRDGLASTHNCDFINDPLFAEAYRLGKATGSWGGADIQWRVHTACWAASHARHLAGDFVECGVNRGGMARAVMHFVDFANLGKTFYLLDTYEGLLDRYISDAERERGIRPGGYSECHDAVCQTFRETPAVVIRGAVPETLGQVPSEQVCYLSIDMNCTAPEIAAATFFWDKLVPGAAVLLDDYGWSAHAEQKGAFDAFASERGATILSLPTGQGLILKPGSNEAPSR